MSSWGTDKFDNGWCGRQGWHGRLFRVSITGRLWRHQHLKRRQVDSCCYSLQSATRGRMGLVSTIWTPSRAPTPKHQRHTTQPVSLPPHAVQAESRMRRRSKMRPRIARWAGGVRLCRGMHRQRTCSNGCMPNRLTCKLHTCIPMHTRRLQAKSRVPKVRGPSKIANSSQFAPSGIRCDRVPDCL